MYGIHYLPLAEQDIDDIVTYLIEKLSVPQAADTLLSEIDKRIDILCAQPYSYPLYQSKYPLKFEIRKVPVKNFLLFYTVIENTVEIHRFLYGKRNLSELLASGELSEWQIQSSFSKTGEFLYSI